MPTPTTDQAAGDHPTPPWGNDEDFSPQRAWALIQNLRAEVDQHKQAHNKAHALAQDLTSQVQALTTERDDATTKVTDLEARLATQATERAKDRLLAAAGLDPDRYAPMLTATTDEDLAAQVQALTDLRATTRPTPSTTPDPAQAAQPATSTRDALAAQVFGD